ncbi:unnamed protein product, partial [Ilex paraguariensis]
DIMAQKDANQLGGKTSYLDVQVLWPKNVTKWRRIKKVDPSFEFVEKLKETGTSIWCPLLKAKCREITSRNFAIVNMDVMVGIAQTTILLSHL